MAITINSAGIFGIDGYKVLVECELSKGLPGFDVVGLPDASVKESRERVRSALKNLKYDYPISKITINLAPADIKKEGTTLDLPILMAILSASKQTKPIASTCAFVGELSLNGEIRPVSGVLSMALALKEDGITDFFVPMQNACEASFCDDLNIYAVESIDQVINHLEGKSLLSPHKFLDEYIESDDELDFSDVIGQHNIRRACEICAAGSHGILLVGSQGTGKSMVAKRMSSIMPKLTKFEQLEVIRINSSLGITKNNFKNSLKRPFRSPHHTVSAVALIGGIGSNKFPKPGEISLAHNGILFLDEFPEFQKNAIDALRTPMEDKKVTISRVASCVTYPCEFILIAAMNPCKCGWYGDENVECICSPASVQNYNAKISGPIIDRIDIFINVQPVKYDDLKKREKGESSKEILKRVVNARKIQEKRFLSTSIKSNSCITPDKMKEFCPLDEQSDQVLSIAYKNLNLTPRSYDRILKLARTIADLDGSENIKLEHVTEAIQYRKQ